MCIYSIIGTVRTIWSSLPCIITYYLKNIVITTIILCYLHYHIMCNFFAVIWYHYYLSFFYHPAICYWCLAVFLYYLCTVAWAVKMLHSSVYSLARYQQVLSMELTFTLLLHQTIQKDKHSCPRMYLIRIV